MSQEPAQQSDAGLPRNPVALRSDGPDASRCGPNALRIELEDVARAAEEHLAAVRRVDPTNAEAARIERVLQSRQPGSARLTANR